MSATGSGAGVMLLILGVLVVTALAVRIGLARLGIPAVAGYLVLGFVLRAADEQVGVLPGFGEAVIDFLGTLGIVALLFTIGLESNLAGLLAQLRSASVIWEVNVIASGAAGYLTARYVLGVGTTESVIVAVAFTATSVGISSQVWKEAGALDSEPGEGFLDVAELDDVSAVALMGMLFALLPDLAGGIPVVSLGAALGWFVAKALLFGALCVGFSVFVEERITRRLEGRGLRSARMLGVFGIGLAIAGAAALLGMSPAIGAFFAGLAFSRDPDRVSIDASIGPISSLLSPFFFLAVGFAVPPGSFGGAVLPGLVLVVAAAVSKLVGTGLPALRSFGLSGAVVIGLSMIPRAEITLVVMERAHREGVVSPDLFSGMVLVAAVTSVLVPVLLEKALGRAGLTDADQRSSRE